MVLKNRRTVSDFGRAYSPRFLCKYRIYVGECDGRRQMVGGPGVVTNSRSFRESPQYPVDTAGGIPVVVLGRRHVVSVDHVFVRSSRAGCRTESVRFSDSSVRRANLRLGLTRRTAPVHGCWLPPKLKLSAFVCILLFGFILFVSGVGPTAGLRFVGFLLGVLTPGAR